MDKTDKYIRIVIGICFILILVILYRPRISQKQIYKEVYTISTDVRVLTDELLLLPENYQNTFMEYFTYNVYEPKYYEDYRLMKYVPEALRRSYAYMSKNGYEVTHSQFTIEFYRELDSLSHSPVVTSSYTSNQKSYNEYVNQFTVWYEQFAVVNVNCPTIGNSEKYVKAKKIRKGPFHMYDKCVQYVVFFEISGLGTENDPDKILKVAYIAYLDLNQGTGNILNSLYELGQTHMTFHN